jgi:hypothetical protein
LGDGWVAFSTKRFFYCLFSLLFLSRGLVWSAEFSPLYTYTPDSVVSLNKNAQVTIGGEVMTDVTWRDAEEGVDKRVEMRRANVRIVADFVPGVRAFFKLDLTDHEKQRKRRLLEEAMLVMDSVGGLPGLGFFAGQGRAPYGQDVTLGIIQSYHHNANEVETPEGRVNIIDPPGDSFISPARNNQRLVLPPMRPGQIDRVVMGGIAYTWDERLKLEAAVYDPDETQENLRLSHPGRHDSNIGFAARLWWRPTENLTVQGSVVNSHSSTMGDGAGRSDLAGLYAVPARKNAWAMSVGFDWRDGPWRFFGEFQQAWDWNHTKNYDVTIAQLGAAREFRDNWRLGAMAEYMRIDDSNIARHEDSYYKGVINLKYAFTEEIYVLVEYGYENMVRRSHAQDRSSRHGNFLGMRFGFIF